MKSWRMTVGLPQGSSGNLSDGLDVFSRGEKMLILTKDIVMWWKEHFEELLNPTNMSSVEEAELEDSGTSHIPGSGHWDS